MSRAAWIPAFLEAQSAELGAARNTLLAYGRDLQAYDAWLAAQSLDFASAQRSDVEAYLVRCDAEGLSKATRARRLSAIKQLFITYSPVEKLTFTLGNFGTHVGYEVIDAPANVNYSTSYMFSNGPFYHTGLKADYAITLQTSHECTKL